MKKIFIIICITSSAIAHAQVKKNVAAKTLSTKTVTPVFKNSVDSFSYAIGLEGASYYKSQGATTVNSALIKRAFEDVYGKKTLLLTPEQSTLCIQNKLMKYMDSKNSIVKEEGKKFLSENKKRSSVVELPNGLQYEIIKQGTGEKHTDERLGNPRDHQQHRIAKHMAVEHPTLAQPFGAGGDYVLTGDFIEERVLGENGQRGKAADHQRGDR